MVNYYFFLFVISICLIFLFPAKSYGQSNLKFDVFLKIYYGLNVPKCSNIGGWGSMQFLKLVEQPQNILRITNATFTEWLFITFYQRPNLAGSLHADYASAIVMRSKIVINQGFNAYFGLK